MSMIKIKNTAIDIKNAAESLSGAAADLYIYNESERSLMPLMIGYTGRQVGDYFSWMGSMKYRARWGKVYSVIAHACNVAMVEAGGADNIYTGQGIEDAPK